MVKPVGRIVITDVLRKSFLVEQLAVVERELDGANGAHHHDLDADDLERARRAVARTRLDVPAGQPTFGLPPGGTRGDAPDLDEVSYFARDPVLSLLQSALDEHLETRHPELLEPEAPVPAGPERRGGDETFVPVADRRLASPGAGKRFAGPFESTDPGWISSFIAFQLRRLHHKRPFNPTPATPVDLDDRARVVLVGDWGSGLPRARRVAEQIRKVLDEGIAAGRRQHVVHLGDVYYSGLEREVEDRFLAPWPVRPDEAETIGSWCLNGNHDMYSGGHGYFDRLLADPRFARQERSSFFSLRSPRWDILGLDTSWDEEALHDPRDELGLQDPQAEWVAARASEPDRKLLLLSHHQLFSAYSKVGPVLSRKLRGPLSAGRIAAWFWGHEHRCMTYEPAQGVRWGRCIGHGGVPVYMNHDADDPYPAPGAYEYREFLGSWPERWALFGFAVLDLDGDAIDVRYLDERGKEHLSERIS
jgi:calcineurin-like phosphoesterase family protein